MKTAVLPIGMMLALLAACDLLGQDLLKEKKSEQAKPMVSAVTLTPRVSITDKIVEKNGVSFFTVVRRHGVYFSDDGERLYIQRGSGSFAGGVGVGIPKGNPNALLGMHQESLTLWDLAAKKKIKDYPGTHLSALSPSGKSLAMVGLFQNRASARLVDAATHQTTRQIDLGKLAGTPFGNVLLPGLVGPAPAFAPDGGKVGIQTGPDAVLWDLKAGRVNKIMTTPAQLLGFAPDGAFMVLLGGQGRAVGFNPAGKPPPKPSDGAFVVWDMKKKSELRRFGDVGITLAVLSPDGKTVASVIPTAFGFGGQVGGVGVPAAGTSARLKLWDVDSGKERATSDTKVVPQPTNYKWNNGVMSTIGGVQGMALPPDGSIVAACLGSGEGGTVHVFDANSGKELTRLDLDFVPQAIAFSRDGAQLAVVGAFGPLQIRVWSVSKSSGSQNTPDTK